MTEARTITLIENQRISLQKESLSQMEGQALHELPSDIIEIGYPTPYNDNCWQLKSGGWVGFLPVTPTLTLILEPKIPISNLFGMWEYAYDINPRFFQGLVQCQSLSESYEQLAKILALKVMNRVRKGLYRLYIEDEDSLPYLRGRLIIEELARNPFQPYFPCHFQDHSVDNEENQILYWTLFCIIRSGVCTENSLPVVLKAYRILKTCVSMTSFSPQKCTNRLYNRLNNDYQPLHALCHFFLEQTGPSQIGGTRQMLPFLFDMDKLFERFVAKWLEQKIRERIPQYSSADHHIVGILEGGSTHFDIDLVLRDAHQDIRWVMDTKYQDRASSDTAHIEQVTAYASSVGATNAALIYPTNIPPKPYLVGGIRVCCLSFPLLGDLEEAGRYFIDQLAELVGKQ